MKTFHNDEYMEDIIKKHGVEALGTFYILMEFLSGREYRTISNDGLKHLIEVFDLKRSVILALINGGFFDYDDTKFRSHERMDVEYPYTEKKEVLPTPDIYHPKYGTQRYYFVDRFIQDQSEYYQVKYAIEKKGRDVYISEQYKAVDMLEKDGYRIELVQLILTFIIQDDFRKKQIMTVKKLRKKNKEGIPYIVALMDKVKEKRPVSNSYTL